MTGLTPACQNDFPSSDQKFRTLDVRLRFDHFLSFSMPQRTVRAFPFLFDAPVTLSFEVHHNP